MIRRIDNSSPWPDDLMHTVFDDNVPDVTIEELLECLTPRTKSIIEYVFRNHMTQKSAAEKFGVTSERIRQIIATSIRKMRHHVIVIEYARKHEAKIVAASKNFDPDDPQFIELMYVTRVCPRCGNKFTFRFSYSTIPPQFCDNCTRELMLKYKKQLLQDFAAKKI